MARVDFHGAGDGLQRAVPEVVEGLLVQVVLLLAEALLKELPLVPELDDRLGVGVEGGDGGGHAAGEGAPRHAAGTDTQELAVIAISETSERQQHQQERQERNFPRSDHITPADFKKRRERAKESHCVYLIGC